MKFSFSIFLVIVLLINAIIRITRLDYPLSGVFQWGDGARDFLIASHIITDKAFPLVGPINLLYDYGVLNSPVYYYLLAAVLLVFNHPLTLGVFNVMLQVGVLIVVFLITRQAFNKQTALVTILLLGFNLEVIKQSDYIWQPHVSYPVALLGLYLLIKSNGNFILLAGCLVLISSAIAIHNSMLPWLPIFLIAALLTLRKWKKPIVYYLGLILTPVLTLALLYGPVFVYLTSHKTNLEQIGNLVITLPDINGYLDNLKTNIVMFLDAFNLANIFILIPVILALLYILKFKKHKYEFNKYKYTSF